MTFSVYQYANFVAAQLTTTANTVVGTVPASTQWIVKDITITNSGGTSSAAYVILGSQVVLYGSGIVSNQTLHMTGLWVMGAAQQLEAWASVANSLQLSINGQTGN